MDNAQKAIMIGVGLFITIIIIAAVMLITGIGQDLLNQGTEKAGSVSSQLSQQETAMYDNTTITGAQVLSAVKKYYNDNTLAVYVKLNTTGGSAWTTPTTYGSAGATNITAAKTTAAKTAIPMGNFTTAGNPNYIPTTSNFKAELMRKNDAVVGILFTQL